MPPSRCLQCRRNYRVCDGRGPACQQCKDAGEEFCSWGYFKSPSIPEAQRDWESTSSRPRTGGSVTHQPPSPSSSSSDALHRLLQTSFEAKHFFEDETCRRMLAADEELQELLAVMEADKNQEQYSAAVANLALGQANHLSQWHTLAMSWQSTAISLIRSNLQSPGAKATSKDLAIATALVNKFELRSPGGDSLGFGLLGGLRALVQQILAGQFSNSKTYSVLAQIIMYHTATGSTFAFPKVASGLPASYIDDLRQTIPAINATPQSLFYGIPLQHYSIIFQIAHARHELKYGGLSKESSERLQQLEQQIWHLERHENPHEKQLASLVEFACLALIAKVLNPSSKAEDVQNQLPRAWTLINEIDWNAQPLSVLWPMLVLYLAGARQHRRTIRVALRTIQYRSGLAKLSSTIDFLDSMELLQDQTGHALLFDLLLTGDVPSIGLF